MGLDRSPPPEFDWWWPAPPALPPPCDPCEPRGVVPPPGVLPGDAESAPVKPRKCHGGESSIAPPFNLADCGRDPGSVWPSPGERPNSRALLASAWSPLASDVENPCPPPLGPDPPLPSGVNRVGWLVDANGSDGDPPCGDPTLPYRGELGGTLSPKFVAVPSDPTPKP